MTLAEQLAVPAKFRRLVSWLLASQRMRPTAAYMAVARPWVGAIGRYVHADAYARFTAVAGEVAATKDTYKHKCRLPSYLSCRAGDL